MAACIVPFLLANVNAQQAVGVDNPVIFIPGILGSKLSDDKGAVIWGDVSRSIRRFHELALPVDPSQTRLVSSGLLERFHILGPWSVGLYASLLDDFNTLGLKPDKTLFVFHYDWRLSVFENARRLRIFVDGLRLQRKLHSDHRVNIVAHSMGGMIARIFVLRFQGQRDVDRLITLATPHFGSLNAVHMLLNGFDGLEDFVAGGPENVRAVAWTLPGLLELLPTYENCCYQGRGQQDPGRTTLQILDFSEWVRRGWVPRTVLNEPGRREALKKSFETVREVGQLMRTPLPGNVTHHKVYGALVDTKLKFFVDGVTGIQRWIDDSGDGTVPMVSAIAGDGLYASPLSAQHATIYRDKRTLPLLKTSLRDVMVPFAAGTLKEEVDIAGQRIETQSIAVRLNRHYYATGTSGRLRIDLVDEERRAIVGATVEVAVMGDAGILTKVLVRFHADGVGGWYEADFSVPAHEGVYRLTITVKGMAAKLEEAFVAVDKGGS